MSKNFSMARVAFLDSAAYLEALDKQFDYLNAQLPDTIHDPIRGVVSGKLTEGDRQQAHARYIIEADNFRWGRSKYVPHQSTREKQRRVAQGV